MSLFQHRKHEPGFLYLSIAIAVLLGIATALPAQQALQMTVHWDKITAASKSTPTLQVVVNPPLRPGQPLGSCFLSGSEGSGRGLCALCAVAALSAAGCGRVGTAHAPKNQLGFYPYRSYDQGFSCRNRRSFDGDELQHYSYLALQDGETGHLSRRSQQGGLGLYAGH